jgi:hypothetical protein
LKKKEKTVKELEGRSKRAEVLKKTMEKSPRLRLLAMVVPGVPLLNLQIMRPR